MDTQGMGVCVSSSDQGSPGFMFCKLGFLLRAWLGSTHFYLSS